MDQDCRCVESFGGITMSIAAVVPKSQPLLALLAEQALFVLSDLDIVRAEALLEFIAVGKVGREFMGVLAELDE